MSDNGRDNPPDRFFDDRKKYLMFVTTASEKWAIAERVGKEIPLLRPQPPALRLFDAGMGDATVLTRVLRELHHHFPTIPFYVVAKEISLEDVRLSLEKIAERFAEHPQTVVVVTNMKYTEAPTLTPRPRQGKTPHLKRWDIPLKGKTAHDFDREIRALQPILTEGWQTEPSPVTGNPLYRHPSLLVLYRADQAFALNSIIPAAEPKADYDLIVCAQPYRARASAEKKVNNVLAPLARALGENGRMVVIQSTGYDPGMEIVRKLWPEEDPFQTPRHDLIEVLRDVLDEEAGAYTFSGYADNDALFKYELHALPIAVSGNIGTSMVLAAWNAAVYVAQIDDERAEEAFQSGAYYKAVCEVLRKHGGLWFLDESFVVKREPQHSRS